MTELRQSLATNEWVIIAPERLKGGALQDTPNPLMDVHDGYAESCPFCPRNVDRFEVIEIDRIVHPDPDNAEGSPWLAQSIENKFKIFSKDPTSPVGPVEFDREGPYKRLAGHGHHELVIESPVHNRTFATMEPHEIEAAIELYRRRFEALDNAGNLVTVIFKNHGVGSGASQLHPHSQVVGMRVVPNYIRFQLEEARRFFDSNGVCVFCKMLSHELDDGRRLVHQNDRFVSFVPYAAASPYEVHLLPRRHAALFSGIDGEEQAALAECLGATMRKLYRCLSNPDFNIVLRNAPYPQAGVPFYHWHLQIAPHLKRPGGFELGARVSVNVVEPEAAAADLRQH